MIANTNVTRGAEYGVRFDADTRNSIAAFNIVELSGAEGAAVKDEGIANMAVNNMAKAILATQGWNNGAPDPMDEGDTFGQTFTVDEGATLTKVRALLATTGTDGTGVTMTLYRGSPAADDLTEVASEELRDMRDNFPQSLEFQEQSGGTYFLELSEPIGTPTWWFHEGDDLTDVGGSAYINRERQSDFNFIFTAFGTR